MGEGIGTSRAREVEKGREWPEETEQKEIFESDRKTLRKTKRDRESGGGER